MAKKSTTADPVGKSKTEPFNKELAKEMAAEAVHKRYPVIPKRLVKNKLDKIEKKASKKGLGM